jgi:hypothetical protein
MVDQQTLPIESTVLRQLPHLLDIPHKNEPSVKSPMAAANTRRVPNLSAPQPLIGMNTARLSG